MANSTCPWPRGPSWPFLFFFPPFLVVPAAKAPSSFWCKANFPAYIFLSSSFFKAVLTKVDISCLPSSSSSVPLICFWQYFLRNSHCSMNSKRGFEPGDSSSRASWRAWRSEISFSLRFSSINFFSSASLSFRAASLSLRSACCLSLSSCSAFLFSISSCFWASLSYLILSESISFCFISVIHLMSWIR